MSAISNPYALPIDGARGWCGELELGFSRRGRRSVLGLRRHRGPLRVQRPFYPEGDDTCHVYVLHPPGGIVGGDELSLNTHVADGAGALITTPGATKVYRGVETSRVFQHLKVASGAVLEWFPQETIVFDGAHLDMRTRVDLADGAGFMGWEILCLGRPASNETFVTGRLRQRIELWRDGSPLLLEQLKIDGDDLQLAPWGTRGKPVLGTFWCVAHDPRLTEQLRGELCPNDGDMFSVTHRRGVLVCRYMGDSTEAARRLLVGAWTLLRHTVMGKRACPPRIWNT